MLSQKLGVANETVSLDLSWKVVSLLSPSTFKRIYLVERRYIGILGTQYTGHSFDTATLVISFSGSKISCLIRIVPEETINSSAFEFVVST